MVTKPASDTGIQPLDLSGLCLSITGHAPLPMAAVEGTSHIVRYANPAFCRLIDRPEEQLVGKSFCEMLPEKDQCVALFDRVLRTGKPESHTEQDPFKPHLAFWSYAMWPVMADERPAGVMIQVTETAELHEKTVAMNEALVVGSVRQHELIEAAEKLNAQLREEIDERKKAEDQLRKNHDTFFNLIQNAPFGLYVVDSQFRLQQVSTASQKVFANVQPLIGRDFEEVLRTLWSDPFVSDALAQFRHTLATGEPYAAPNTVQPRSDIPEIESYDWKIERITLPDGNFGVVCYFYDVTERNLTEEALRRAQSQLMDRAGQLEGLVARRTSELTATNQQLEAFVYSIAHDLRAPLRAIQGFSTMLVKEAGTALSETARGYAARINKSALFMDALLIDLLAFSRISQQRVELAPVNLATVVGSVLARLQNDIQEKDARVESSGPWPAVLAHEPTLAQVLFNLTSNALKFTMPGVPPVLRLRAEEQEDFIRVWVEDNGLGIEPDHQEQIFRLFTRLNGEKYAGTGIGLAIVQKGVERMGGRVGVESAAGQGSRFWFELRKA